MQVAINQPKILTVNDVVKAETMKKSSNDNWVITIDLSRQMKVLNILVCCLEAGFINGKKYGGI